RERPVESLRFDSVGAARRRCSGRAPERRARASRRDRRSVAGERLLRHELLELPRLGRDRLSPTGERRRSRPRGAARLRSPSAPPNRRDRSRLLRADSGARPRPLRRAASGGLPVLREGAGGGHFRGPARRIGGESRFSRAPEVPRRGDRSLPRGLRRARRAVHPPVSAVLSLAEALAGSLAEALAGALRRETRTLPLRAAAGFSIRR